MSKIANRLARLEQRQQKYARSVYRILIFEQGLDNSTVFHAVAGIEEDAGQTYTDGDIAAFIARGHKCITVMRPSAEGARIAR